MKQRMLILLYALLLPLAVVCQSPASGTISGKVYAEGNTAATNATVFLLRSKDSAVI